MDIFSCNELQQWWQQFNQIDEGTRDGHHAQRWMSAEKLSYGLMGLAIALGVCTGCICAGSTHSEKQFLRNCVHFKLPILENYKRVCYAATRGKETATTAKIADGGLYGGVKLPYVAISMLAAEACTYPDESCSVRVAKYDYRMGSNISRGDGRSYGLIWAVPTFDRMP